LKCNSFCSWRSLKSPFYCVSLLYYCKIYNNQYIDTLHIDSQKLFPITWNNYLDWLYFDKAGFIREINLIFLNFFLHTTKVMLKYQRATNATLLSRHARVLSDSKNRSTFPFVLFIRGMEGAHARTEVIVRDTQANAGYAAHTSQFRVYENICTKNWVRIGPNSWNLTKLFALLLILLPVVS